MSNRTRNNVQQKTEEDQQTPETKTETADEAVNETEETGEQKPAEPKMKEHKILGFRFYTEEKAPKDKKEKKEKEPKQKSGGGLKVIAGAAVAIAAVPAVCNTVIHLIDVLAGGANAENGTEGGSSYEAQAIEGSFQEIGGNAETSVAETCSEI